MHSQGAQPSLFSFSPVAPDNGFRMDDFWVWCPSMVQAPDGVFHMFASRWPKPLPFHPGWLTNSEVVRAIAERPEGPYRFVEVVLPRRGPEYWDGCMTHNPSIRKLGGRYYLYYIGSTFPFSAPLPGEELPMNDPRVTVSRSRKRIGLAWADSLDGPWHRSERPILDTKAGTFYSFLTSNPAPCIDPESGAVTMIFKARAYEGDVHGRMTLGLATANHPEAEYRVTGEKPLFQDDLFTELEDPFLWKKDGMFHMVAKDMVGTVATEPGAAIHAESTDLISWRRGTPAIAWKKAIPGDDGTLMRCGSMERPFLFSQNGNLSHLCVAASDGSAGFVDAKNSWNAVIPLKM